MATEYEIIFSGKKTIGMVGDFGRKDVYARSNLINFVHFEMEDSQLWYNQGYKLMAVAMTQIGKDRIKSILEGRVGSDSVRGTWRPINNSGLIEVQWVYTPPTLQAVNDYFCRQKELVGKIYKRKTRSLWPTDIKVLSGLYKEKLEEMERRRQWCLKTI